MKRAGLRFWYIGVFSALILALSTATAQGATDFDNAPQGAHYAQGSAEPVCTVSGTTVTCTATAIAGVGNTNATVELDVTSTISGVCRNPGTNRKVVEPFSDSITESTSSELTSTKNGRLNVPAQSATGVSSAEFLETFTCPNPNWEASVTSNVLSFEYTLTFAGFTDPAILITG
jgi:hypothetical protein